jgi:SAM-dependent methyltransferase
MVSARPARPAALVDARNRQRYAKPSVVAEYGDMRSWVDRGESMAFLEVADEVRGQPVLDVGVGGGRTSWWLRLLTHDYVAIDYSTEMVAVCRESCPGIDVRVGDARDLADFDNDHFGLVVFTFNGFDSVNHEDRRRVLEEFHRVLRPSGLLVFSTHNKCGPAWREAPWQRARYTEAHRPRAERTARLLARMALRPRAEIEAYRNWWRLRRCVEDHGDWAIGPGPGDNFGALIHFVSPEGERQELAGTGFDCSQLFTDQGNAISPLEAAPGSFWFYAVARKRAAPSSPPPWSDR